MNTFLAEFIGTAILIILGNGVVSNVVLQQTKGNNSGWIVIAFGWAIAVFAGVLIAAPHSGAHLNPAVTVALALEGKTPWQELPVYLGAQFGGAMAGQVIVWLLYFQHFEATRDGEALRACFCNTPAIRHPFFNLLTETLATFAFVFTVLCLVAPGTSLGSLDALPVALLVLGVGLSLGGPTGYAINPARDLGPRIVYTFLPLKGKASNDWQYGWIPVAGPMLGGILAAIVHTMLV